jgi:hypothetical protein
MRFMNVDLPDPEAPMMAVNSPRPISSVTSASAVTETSPAAGPASAAHERGRPLSGVGIRRCFGPLVADHDPIVFAEIPGNELGVALVLNPRLHLDALEAAIRLRHEDRE